MITSHVHLICCKHPKTGGNGETRTHTPISEPSAFKAAAAMPIRLTFPYLGPHGRERSFVYRLSADCSTFELHEEKLLVPPSGYAPDSQDFQSHAFTRLALAALSIFFGVLYEDRTHTATVTT